MSARNRLWESFKEKLLFVGIALIITVGFPIIVGLAGRDLSDIPGLVKLDQMGYYVLRAAPIMLLLLFLYNLWDIKRRQKRINQKISTEGVTYLMLPRPDGPTVLADQVTLWHRIALALPYYEHISFEMTGGENGVVFSLRTTDESTARNILAKVMAEWPGTQMRHAETDPLEVAKEAYWIEVKPMKRDQPIVSSTADPLKALLSEIAVLPKGVQAGLQVLVREDPFTRLHHGRRADSKTRKKPDPKTSPIVINSGSTNTPTLRPSAEERRQIHWLDERAQEAFLETRLIVWAASDNDKTARQTAIRLAETVAAQYHPNNKLIKGWRCKKGNLMARSCPTFAGRPWVASELGTIAHLCGSDALLAAPQLKVAPARPLPASPDCRLPAQASAAIYLLEKDFPDMPILILEEFDSLPELILEKEEFDSVPIPLVQSGLPRLPKEKEVLTQKIVPSKN